MAVLQGGALYSWGKGHEGQLGHGQRADRGEPALIATGSDATTVADAVLPYFVQAACGMAHTMALTEDGRVYSFGGNARGQLGLGDRELRPVPTCLRAAGLGGTRIVLIAAGLAHTVAVSEAGALFSWGEGENGQLGHNDGLGRLSPCPVAALEDRPVAVTSCGALHTLAVMETGNLYSWGENNQGQLGLGDLDRRLLPVPVSPHVFSARRQSVGRAGDGCAGSRISMAAGGFEFSAAVLESGAVFTWGYGISLCFSDCM